MANRRFHNHSMRVDDNIWKRIRITAVKENMTVGEMITEAFLTWQKWLKKAELEEQVAENIKKSEGELEELTNLLEESRRKRRGKKLLKAALYGFPGGEVKQGSE